VFLAANALEWLVHKHVMHRPFGPLRRLYQGHTLHHHRIFSDTDMEIRSTREFKFVLMPWYAQLGIVAISAPFTLTFLALGLRNAAALFVAADALYVLVYEWLHLAYHLPADGAIGRLRGIARLRRHHATHHDPSLMSGWHFNVSAPLWDWVQGTIRPPDGPDIL
jgi:hypothetical protein